MTEDERLAALSMARMKALEYATAIESPVKLRAMAVTEGHAIERANMWACVAQAMRDGNADREPLAASAGLYPDSPTDWIERI